MNRTNPQNVQYSQGNVNLPPPPPPPGIQMQWMQKPTPIPGVPPGLEYLHQIDKLLVQQKVDLLEAFTGWEQNNKYVVRNVAGQQVYYAFEDTETCMRICCGAQRGFKIHIVDNMNQEVLRISRDFKCCAGNCWCAGCCDGCAHEVKIETPTGQILGFVRQKGSCWKPHYHILDGERNSLFNIDGPCCICNGPFCPCTNEFIVMDLKTENPIGKVSKEYAGFVKEMFTTADNFSINFPVETPVPVKACFLGALFLIDFMYFEQKNNDNRNF